MKKTGIFYASATGTTAGVARRIAAAMGVADSDVHDVVLSAPEDLGKYDLLIIGSSTHGTGDIEEDMADFLDGVEALDLSGKKIALFGTGNVKMATTFCDAVGKMYGRLKATGATFVGRFPADEYTFVSSAACDGDTMLGLVIDQNNYPEITGGRIDRWVKLL